MNKIKLLNLDNIYEFIDIQNKDNIVLFDNLEKSHELIGILAYPVKLNYHISIFLLNGSMTVRIGHEDYILKPHDSVSILKGKIYQPLHISSDAKLTICCMNEEFFNTNPDISKTCDIYNRLLKNPVVNLSENNASEYLATYRNIKKYLNEIEHSCRIEIIKNYCYIIFNLLCDELIKEKEVTKHNISRKESIYQSFISHIEKHYRNERSVKFYADKLCLTPKYLSSVIHQMSGKHASEWLDDFIMLEIKALLKTTNMPVQQIAYELNFSTPAHFGKFFKRITGISPKRYRQFI